MAGKKSQRINLTTPIIKAVEPPAAGRVYVYDGKTPGLAVAVTANGVKSFYLYRRVHGKPSRIQLGRFPMMTLDQARDAVARENAGIVDGRDPNAEKRAARKAMTLGKAFDHFHENRTTARGAVRTAKTNKSRFETCLNDWRERTLAGIRREEVIARHVQLGKDRGHVTANRAVQLLRAVFNYADKALNIKLPNPASQIELFQENPRERYLLGDELPKFFTALEGEPDETFRDFFAVCLWTGARRGNVQAMRWDDVNLTDSVWVNPATKIKTRKNSVTIVLTADALVILKRRRSEIAGEWVFPTHSKTGHLVEPKTAWERLLTRAGLKNLRIHDLRRTLGSWQAAGGSSLHIIGKSLGHVRPETTAIYARLQIDPVRQSVEAAAKAIADAGRRDQSSDTAK